MAKTTNCLGNSIILVLSVLVILCLGSLTEAAPYQELEPRKGHVPVYIRHGDEPLSEIHPGLAEAFKEGHSKDLEGESLVTTTSAPTASSTTTNPSSPPAPSTESDIASFEAIKAKTE
ncbi:uncharacterized protein LOC110183694 [Drosophila serrata]|uniref:uncharacterized protein LOC110183694 n=1 Tax=Drosophila serrata TaxID=7274 RepID=UPI000A1D1FF3|nr:uncharacterized protein LOC110183694 [Drosophila serrata]